MSEIDLMRFCGDRGKIEQPWIKDSYKYATDGCVCIRLTSSESNMGCGPSVVGELKGWDIRGSLVPWFEPQGEHLCPNCNHYNECPYCSKYLIVHANTPEDIITLLKCRTCDGDGVINYPRLVKTEYQVFWGKYIHLCSTLPGIKRVVYKPADLDEQMKFVFAGGEGMLMPTAEKV